MHTEQDKGATSVHWSLDGMRSYWKQCCLMECFEKWYPVLFGVDLSREEWKEANESRGLKGSQEGDGSAIQRSKSSDGESVPASRTLFWRQRKWYLLMS